MKFTKPSVAIGVAGLLLLAADVLQAEGRDGSLTYRYFHAEEANGRVLSMMPVPADPVPRWARDVSQEKSRLACEA